MAGMGAALGGAAGAWQNWECDPVGGFINGAIIGALTGSLGAVGSGMSLTDFGVAMLTPSAPLGAGGLRGVAGTIIGGLVGNGLSGALGLSPSDCSCKK